MHLKVYYVLSSISMYFQWDNFYIYLARNRSQNLNYRLCRYEKGEHYILKYIKIISKKCIELNSFVRKKRKINEVSTWIKKLEKEQTIKRKK